MLARGQFHATDQDALEFRRKALRDAVLCIGLLKFLSVICFLLIYALVHVNNKGNTMGSIIEIMILVVIALQIIHGVILCLGSILCNLAILFIAVALFPLIGLYSAALGIMGIIHFITTGHLTMHFILIIVFLLLALSSITVVCHDFFIVLAFIRFIRSKNNPRTESVSVDPKYVNSASRMNPPKEIIEDL